MSSCGFVALFPDRVELGLGVCLLVLLIDLLVELVLSCSPQKTLLLSWCVLDQERRFLVAAEQARNRCGSLIRAVSLCTCQDPCCINRVFIRHPAAAPASTATPTATSLQQRCGCLLSLISGKHACGGLHPPALSA